MITIKTLLILCFILAILYLYAIIWVLVGFSSISISTGEWKPRGLYLDETSIQHMNWLHSHSISDQWHVYSPVENKVTNQSICLELSKKNFSSSSTLFVPTDCKRYEWNNHSVDFYEITITPVYKLIDSDIIVLVITYFHKDELFIRNILSQLVSVYSYHTPWLSKRIIILLLSINHHFTEDESENNSNMVDFNPYISWWLRNYHADSYFLSSNNHPSPTNHFHKQNVINQGIIREAYIINFCHNMTTNNKSISKNQSIYSWDHIGLYTIGRNGQQPNMDIVSLLLLSTDSKNIVLSEKYEIIKETLTFIFKYIGLSNIAKNMEKGYIMDKQIWLLSYWLDMIYQRPGNDLHSLFLERNIDSITIQPQSYGEKNIISEIDLFGMIEKLIHSSSLLQGSSMKLFSMNENSIIICFLILSYHVILY